MAALKLSIQVFAGVIPGQPEEEFTRSWFWTGEQQDALVAGDKEAEAEYIRIAGESREYAATLENPKRFNWVKREWLWL